MSKLYFRYGAMNSGKSTNLLQIAHNYEERGQNVLIIKPSTDTKASAHIQSRLGVERSVDILLSPTDSLLKHFGNFHKKDEPTIHCVIIDEAQFLTAAQVDEAFQIAVLHDVPVIAYGLRGDFQTKSFPGSLRLLEISHSIEELKTICRCGKKAILNGRIINGQFVKSGVQVAIDGQQAEYESLCGACYISKVGPVRG